MVEVKLFLVLLNPLFNLISKIRAFIMALLYKQAILLESSEMVLQTILLIPILEEGILKL